MIDVKTDNAYWHECGECYEKKVCYEFSYPGYEYNDDYYLCADCMKLAIGVITSKNRTISFSSESDYKKYVKTTS